MKPCLFLARAAAITGWVAACLPTLGQPCPPYWDPSLGQPGLQQLGSGFAMQVFNARLYAGGLFFIGGTGTFQGIARWDGSMWVPVGDGVGGGTPGVAALAVFNDGSGPALYAGGRFMSAGGNPAIHIARWDDTSWSTLGSGVNPGVAGQSGVFALAVFDDGGGPALYAGGEFSTAGAAVVNNIAKWNGSFWAPLGSGFANGVVYALCVYDDGTGPALYAGGNLAGGPSGIAKWTSLGWSALPSQVSGTVFAFAVFNGELYAGGEFLNAGSVSAPRVAKWNGNSWSALGAGLDNTVRALAVFDDGSGPAVFAGGDFVFSGTQFVNHVAAWNGTTWRNLQGGTNGPVLGMGLDGRSLVIGGLIGAVGSGQPATGVARWVNCTPCYPNCNGSTTQPFLNVNDFACFLNAFAAGLPYANCDASTVPPVLNVNDFFCFINQFAAGCP